MNCLAHIVKYILFLFNLLFVLCGILLIVLGSLILSSVKNLPELDNLAGGAKTIPILIIVLGCIVFVVAFFGCCGAIREDVCCMSVYAIFMFIIFVLQLALVIWIFVKRSDFLNAMDKVVNEAWSKNDQSHGFPMDIIQLSFKCCGLSSYDDYRLQHEQVPNSCCGTLSQSQTCEANVYSTKPGCRKEFNDFWSSQTNIIRYAGIGVVLVELVALIFACSLVSSFRKQRHMM